MKRKIVGLFVFMLLIATSLTVSGDNNASTSPNHLLFTDALVQIDTTDGNIQLPRGVEILGGKPGEWLNIILPNMRLWELSDADIEYSILISDVDSYSDLFRGQYHTLA